MKYPLKPGLEIKTTRVTVTDDDNFLVAEFPSRETANEYIDLANKYDTLKASHTKLSNVLSVVSAHTEEDFGYKRCRKLIKKALSEAEKL